ncbi:hypothetical protein IAD21_04098 [Abditibacteriota bacterium]|nr:hypothetical protein IAD21_04098 [Abditibacteriota bacterium]
MKKIALLAALAAASATVVAPSAHAAGGPTTGATSVLTLTVPSTITFTAADVAFGTLPDSTSNATGQSVAATLNTNYDAVSLQVRALSAGTTRTTASGVILAGDIEVSNGGFQALTTTDASFGSLTGFSPNVTKNYNFPVKVKHIDNYEQGAYTNSIIFTATGS